METHISSKGQVVIPKVYRQKLGLETGTALLVEEANGQLLLSPKPAIDRKQPLSDLIGCLHGSRPGKTEIKDMDAAVAASFKNWKV